MSLLLHLIIIAATMVIAPFEIKKNYPYDEVIRVSLTSLPQRQLPPVQPQAIPPTPIPEALTDVLPEIPIDAPSTVKKAATLTKKKKPKKKKQPAPQKTVSPATNQTEKTEQTIETPATGSGSPFQGATIDNASFNYPYWFTQAFNKIAGNWRNPVMYDGTLVCVVYFQVLRSGRVIDLKVVEPSGIPAFDRACLQAIERSAPFPPLPREFRDEIIGITVPFKNR